MKVVALKPILYSGKVYDKGETIEMDEVTYLVRLKRGEVELVKVLDEFDVVDEIVSEGLPALDEVPNNTRKKKNGA